MWPNFIFLEINSVGSCCVPILFRSPPKSFQTFLPFIVKNTWTTVAISSPINRIPVVKFLKARFICCSIHCVRMVTFIKFGARFCHSTLTSPSTDLNHIFYSNICGWVIRYPLICPPTSLYAVNWGVSHTTLRWVLKWRITRYGARCISYTADV